MIEGIEQKEILSIDFENVHFDRWDGLPLFDGISFKFPMNITVRVRGKLGTGVSTVLKMLCGITRPKAGGILMSGVNVTNLPEKEFRSFVLNIGSAFDPEGLISHYSLEENLMLPLMYHSSLSQTAVRERALRYLKHFELFGKKDLRPGVVSSGTRKTCALARSFMMRPQVLLLDEPTLGLGRGAIERVVEMIELHRKHFDLRHVFIGTEDELFLSYFDYHTVDIVEQRLELSGRKIKKEAASGS